MSLIRISSFALNRIIFPRSTLFEQTRAVKRWVSPTLKELRKRREKLGPEPEKPRSTFIEWNYNAELFAFGKRLNESFDLSLLQQAFTHRSYIIQEEIKQKSLGITDPEVNNKDNDELIKIGESIMKEYIRSFLKVSLPKLPTEGLTAVQNHLLSEEVLANISKNLGTKDIVLCDEFPVENKTLASTFKAIVGALSQSSGEDRAYIFVRDFVCTQLNQIDINELWHIENPQKYLHDLCLDLKLDVPEPRLLGECGKNTLLAAYNVGIYCNKELLGSGFGDNVENAIDEAARDSLRVLFGTKDHMKPFNFELSLESLNNQAAMKKNVV